MPALLEQLVLGKVHRAAVCGDLAAVGHDSAIALWDLRAGKKLRTLRALPHQGQPAFSADGSLLAVKNPHGDLAIITVRTGARVAVAKRKTRDQGPDPVFIDNAALIDAAGSGVLAVRDARSLDVVSEIEVAGQIETLAVAKNTIAACVRRRGSDDASLVRWRWQRGKLATVGAAVAIAGGWNLAFGPSLSEIAYIGATGMLEVHRLRSTSTDRVASRPLAKTGAPRSEHQLGTPFRISFSPDGKLVAAGDGQMLAILDARTLEPKHAQPWPGVSGLVFGDGVVLVESWTRGAVLGW